MIDQAKWHQLQEMVEVFSEDSERRKLRYISIVDAHEQGESITVLNICHELRDDDEFFEAFPICRYYQAIAFLNTKQPGHAFEILDKLYDTHQSDLLPFLENRRRDK